MQSTFISNRNIFLLCLVYSHHLVSLVEPGCIKTRRIPAGHGCQFNNQEKSTDKEADDASSVKLLSSAPREINNCRKSCKKNQPKRQMLQYINRYQTFVALLSLARINNAQGAPCVQSGQPKPAMENQPASLQNQQVRVHFSCPHPVLADAVELISMLSHDSRSRTIRLKLNVHVRALDGLLTHGVTVLASTQGQQGSYIVYILQALEQRHKMHQVVVGGIVDPALDRNGIVYFCQYTANRKLHWFFCSPSWNR